LGRVILLTGLMVGAGLAVVFAGVAPYLRAAAPGSPVDERMRYYAMPRVAAVGSELNDVSFLDRMVKPLVEQLRTAVLSRAPTQYQEQLERDLILIGRPYGLGGGDVIIGQLTVSIAGAGIGVLLGLVSRSFTTGLGAAAILAVMGWLFVSIALRRAISAHRQGVLRSLPEVIDFLAVAAEAGLGFDAAMARVVAKAQNPLTNGIAQVLGEVQLGRGRSEALAAYAERTGVEELSAFIHAVLNSQVLGIPLAQTLRVQADEMRWRRRERARQRGAQAPLKMTLPMVAFIFPTIWLVLLGPALFEIFGHGV
jgi:tight adherence protein C